MPISLNLTSSRLTQWIPDSSVTNHSGQPIPENSIFFANSPIEIGRLISAETTLIKHQRFSFDRVIKSILFAIAIILGGILSIIIFPIALILMLLKLNDYVLWSLNRRYHNRYFCTYVGEYGLAIYSLKNGLWLRPKCELVLFQDQVALYTGMTSTKVNGIYRNTQYHFTWKNIQQKSYKIAGAFHQYKKFKFDHILRFATAAEAAWNHYLQNQFQQQLEQNGYIEFPIIERMGKFTAIRVGIGFVEFVPRKGETQRFLDSEINTVSHYYGWLAFIPRGLKQSWLGRLRNRYCFRSEKIGNIQFLIASLKTLTKIPLN